uniref:Leucine rich repeat and sterile alpha motif containing 1 n=1 Tax=Myripristis murdjan TaxID=586833 RepID=A0A667XC69_9TELE
MPLFFRKRKPSQDSQKRFEYQLCLVRNRCIPCLFVCVCVLILHSNALRSLLPKGCDITTLATLKVLDLHENKLTSLPDDIGKLTSLQVLNLEKNSLKVLPESVGTLRFLQTLNVKGNLLTSIPSSVGSMSSLRTLDLSDNNIRELPKSLAYIRTLESFTLDAAMMSYPPASVCTGGTESIQRFLCDELGEEYCPPSQYLLPVLETDCGKHNSDSVDGLEQAWHVGNKSASDQLWKPEQKQQEKLAFERHLEEKQKEHTQLLLMNNSRKEDILLSVRQEQERLEQGVSQQQRAQEAERLLVLGRVRQAENDISSRISNLLTSNNRQKKSAEFLAALEEDRIRMEQLTAITQEEANSLRKREVASDCQRTYEVRHYKLNSFFLFPCPSYYSMENMDRKFDQVLSLQVLDKSKAIAHILQEVPSCSLYLHCLQIKLIEGELMQLTKLEVKRRNLDAENLQEVLVEQRSALGDLLQQLLKQKDQRESELRQVLQEMELKSESSQQNYWMIQYQRLLDAKPLSLRMQEAGVEKELVNLLCKLSAQHYLPILAHHRVTSEALRHMTASDLNKVSLGTVPEAEETVPTAPSPPSTPSSPFTSAMQINSPPRSPGTPVTPSAPSPVEGPGSSECVVCMETGSQVIFLPCGHVCCCQICSDALQNCPLCRSNISQRIRLYQN